MSLARQLSRAMSRRLGRSPAIRDGGLQLLPGRANLVFLMEMRGGVLQPDSIGLSAILYQSGDASTLQTTAVWGFERNAVTIAIDAALGGGVLFVNESVEYWTWEQWVNLPQINVDYLFFGDKGVAGYSTDQTAKAAKIKSALRYSETPIDYYADSVNGDDSNDGTAGNPVQSISALLALNPPAGSVIGLAKGSHWREKLALPADNVLLKSYGTGDYPLIDGSDIIAPESFAKTGGYTNIYEVSLAVETSVLAAEWPGMWVDGTRLTKAANMATCDATPGTIYYGTVADTTPITLYVHPPGSTDPTSDSKTYEASVKGGVDAYARTGCVIKGIRGRRNYTSYGSINVGANLAVGCKADEGNSHNFFVSPGGRAIQCTAHNAYSDGTSVIPFIFFASSPNATHELPFDQCSFTSDTHITPGNGYYCHTGGAAFASVTFKDCNSDNISNPFAFANTALGIVDGGTISSFLIILGTSVSARIRRLTGADAKVGAHWGNFTAAGITIDITGNTVTFNTTGYVRFLANNQTITFEDNTITGANTIIRSTSALTGTTFNHNRNTYIGGLGTDVFNITDSPIVVSDNNSYGGAAGVWKYGGSSYANLGAWQTFSGQDLNSTNVAP